MKINTIFGTLHTDERIHVMKRTKIEINKQMNGLNRACEKKKYETCPLSIQGQMCNT